MKIKNYSIFLKENHILGSGSDNSLEIRKNKSLIPFQKQTFPTEKNDQLRFMKTAIMNNDISSVELYLKKGPDLENHNYLVLKWSSEYGKIEILEILFKRLEETMDENFMSGESRSKIIEMCIEECQDSDEITNEEKKRTIEFLKRFLGGNFLYIIK